MIVCGDGCDVARCTVGGACLCAWFVAFQEDPKLEGEVYAAVQVLQKSPTVQWLDLDGFVRSLLL